MKCANCPLYSWWNNENDKGEACGIFGDGWDNQLQYEDKNGNIVGCYVDRHYIEKVDERYLEHMGRIADQYFADSVTTSDEGEYVADNGVYFCDPDKNGECPWVLQERRDV